MKYPVPQLSPMSFHPGQVDVSDADHTAATIRALGTQVAGTHNNLMMAAQTIKCLCDHVTYDQDVTRPLIKGDIRARFDAIDADMAGMKGIISAVGDATFGEMQNLRAMHDQLRHGIE